VKFKVFHRVKQKVVALLGEEDGMRLREIKTQAQVSEN
jgi:hypothetical protein